MLNLDPESKSFNVSLMKLARLEGSNMWLAGLRVLEMPHSTLIFTWNYNVAMFHDIDGRLSYKYN
jgi:hypothetical protein